MSTKEAEQYNRGMWLLENGALRKLRHTLLKEVTGQVLEIGAGTGVNLPLYSGVQSVTAVDINMPRLLGVTQRSAAIPFRASCTDAHHLPFADKQFDTVVGTLVFCSIPDPIQALTEIRRVLKSNGRLFLLEHVRGQGPISRRLTDWLHPAWFALQGECHLNRETAVAVEQAGFNIERNSVHGWGVLQMITATP